MNIKKIVLIILLQSVTIDLQIIKFPNLNKPLQEACSFEGDNIIYMGIVNISGKIDSLDYFSYEIKLPNSDFNGICFLDLHQCNGHFISNCYCMSTDDKDVFEVVISITGQTRTSEAVLRGQLIFFDQHIYSEEIKLPKIYDAFKEHAFIFINDKAIDLRSCDESINGSHVTIVFFLNHSENLPCRLEITDSMNKTLKETSSSHLSYSASVYGNQTFILSYELCGSVKKESFSCNIIADNEDQANPGVHLLINNENVNLTNCEETVNSSEVLIIFYISDFKHSVKRLVIEDDTYGETRESTTFMLIYSYRIRGNQTFTLRYELDGLVKIQENFHCRIYSGSEKSNVLPSDICELLEENKIERILLIVSVVILVPLNALYIIRLIQRKKCIIYLQNKNKCIEGEQNEQFSVEEPEENVHFIHGSNVDNQVPAITEPINSGDSQTLKEEYNVIIKM